MMGFYATAQDVLDYLYIMFDVGDPTPLVQKFQNWIDARINEAETKLEEKCRTAWREVITTEYFKRSTAWQFAEGRLRNPIIPSYQPLRSVDSVEIDYGTGWQLLTAGTDYIIRANEILITRKLARAWTSFNAVKVTYRYGYSTVAADVKGAVIRMVVIELFTTANLQPFLERMPSERTLQEMKEWVREVIARYSTPQLLPR